MAIIARENSSLRRRSGVRNAAANACSTCPPLVGRLRLAIEGPRPPHRSQARGDPLDGAEGEGQGSFGVQNVVVLPPAAPIFSAADDEKACAVTSTLMPPRSPVPSTLTGWPRRTAPASARASGPIVPPCGNSAAIRSRLTTWNTTLFGFLKPASFGSRMCSGVCPPSKRGLTLPRAPEPFVPRPAVLPLEPSPRPTRVFGVWAPFAGRRWWTLRVIDVPCSAD